MRFSVQWSLLVGTLQVPSAIEQENVATFLQNSSHYEFKGSIESRNAQTVDRAINLAVIYAGGDISMSKDVWSNFKAWPMPFMRFDVKMSQLQNVLRIGPAAKNYISRQAIERLNLASDVIGLPNAIPLFGTLGHPASETRGIISLEFRLGKRWFKGLCFIVDEGLVPDLVLGNELLRPEHVKYMDFFNHTFYDHKFLGYPRKQNNLENFYGVNFASEANTSRTVISVSRYAQPTGESGRDIISKVLAGSENTSSYY